MYECKWSQQIRNRATTTTTPVLAMTEYLVEVGKGIDASFQFRFVVYNMKIACLTGISIQKHAELKNIVGKKLKTIFDF